MLERFRCFRENFGGPFSILFRDPCICGRSATSLRPYLSLIMRHRRIVVQGAGPEPELDRVFPNKVLVIGFYLVQL